MTFEEQFDNHEDIKKIAQLLNNGSKENVSLALHILKGYSQDDFVNFWKAYATFFQEIFLKYQCDYFSVNLSHIDLHNGYAINFLLYEHSEPIDGELYSVDISFHTPNDNSQGWASLIYKFNEEGYKRGIWRNEESYFAVKRLIDFAAKKI